MPRRKWSVRATPLVAPYKLPSSISTEFCDGARRTAGRPQRNSARAIRFDSEDGFPGEYVGSEASLTFVCKSLFRTPSCRVLESTPDRIPEAGSHVRELACKADCEACPGRTEDRRQPF